MDPQSVSSNSKCSSSDFSIKRILSESSSGEAPADSPNWLCCTRYQPPRLPRSNITASRPRRSGRHARVPFTGAQAAALEAAYSRAPYLAPPALRALAAALALREDRIKIWFQNRRARERREKNGNITPPRAVPLQPTTIPCIISPVDLTQPWSRLQSTEHLSPVNYKHDVDTKYVSSNTTSADSYLMLSYNNQIITASDTNRTSASDNERCESPLDIETIDQGSATGGPRSVCGPRKVETRTAKRGIV